MNKIVSVGEINSVLSKNQKKIKPVVLTGGCFDILHIGHINFLAESKKQGKTLIVLLENDNKVKKLKGNSRPIFTETERAKMLASLAMVDYVVLLPEMNNNNEYDKLISQIKPDIITITQNDPLIDKKKIQADNIKAKLHIVPFTKTYSSSKLAQILGVE